MTASKLGITVESLHLTCALFSSLRLQKLIFSRFSRYVGNLDLSVTEEFIATLFGQIGPVTKTKVIFDVSWLAKALEGSK